jgi:hypothetical protein
MARASATRDSVTGQFDALEVEFARQHRDAGHDAARPGERAHEARFEQVVTGKAHDDRRRGRGRLHGQGRSVGYCDDHVGAQRGEFARLLAEPTERAVSAARFDAKVDALDEAFARQRRQGEPAGSFDRPFTRREYGDEIGPAR